MIGFVVCVNYADCLVHTLPSSSKLFEKLYVITSERDPTTLALSLPPNCEFFVTEEFWSPGASFNKFAALEKCIDYVGRYARKVYGIIDADIVFPEIIKPAEELFQRECLTVPFRRMYYGDMPFPGVQDWEKLTRHRLVRHFSGYAQFFWANDPVLRNKPDWFGRTHRDASTGDTVFQSRWNHSRRRRPKFEVLHLGPDRVNWQGRKSPPVVSQCLPESLPCE